MKTVQKRERLIMRLQIQVGNIQFCYFSSLPRGPWWYLPPDVNFIASYWKGDQTHSIEFSSCLHSVLSKPIWRLRRPAQNFQLLNVIKHHRKRDLVKLPECFGLGGNIKDWKTLDVHQTQRHMRILDSIAIFLFVRREDISNCSGYKK